MAMSDHVKNQITNARLPTGGTIPFIPELVKNKKGEDIVKKVTIEGGPKKGKKGYVDDQGRIWIRDRAHGDVPDHWDLQENGGKAGHTRVGDDGEPIP